MIEVTVCLTSRQAEAILNAVGLDNGKYGVRSTRAAQEAYERIASAVAAQEAEAPRTNV